MALLAFFSVSPTNFSDYVLQSYHTVWKDLIFCEKRFCIDE